MGKQIKAMTWAGWILSALVGLLLIFSATMKFMNPPEVGEMFVGKLGYPQNTLLAIASWRSPAQLFTSSRARRFWAPCC